MRFDGDPPGYEIVHECPQPMPMILMLSPHHRSGGELAPLAPVGARSSSRRFEIHRRLRHSLHPDRRVGELAGDLLSFPDPWQRTCGGRGRAGEAASDRGSAGRRAGLPAWQPLLRYRPPVGRRLVAVRTGSTGWRRVHALCGHAHERMAVDDRHASATSSAADTHREQCGVCGDDAHLAITLRRCLNIPARYGIGFLGAMGAEAPYGAMDFAAWFEVCPEGGRHVFDACNDVPRSGASRSRAAAMPPTSPSPPPSVPAA